MGNGSLTRQMKVATPEMFTFVAFQKRGGRPRRISATGGAWAHWREDGKELFYLNGNGHLVAVQVKLDGGFSVSPEKIITLDPITSNPYNIVQSFNIPVDNTHLMSGMQTFGNLFCNLNGILDLHWPSFDLIRNGLSFDIFHGDEGLTFMFVDLENGCNIVVIQLGSGFGFLLEALFFFASAKLVGWQKF